MNANSGTESSLSMIRTDINNTSASIRHSNPEPENPTLTFRKVQHCSCILELIAGILTAILSGMAILSNIGSGVGHLGIGFGTAIFIFIASGFGFLNSRGLNNRCLLTTSSMFTFFSILAALVFLLVSLTCFVLDKSLLDFCYQYGIKNCPYHLLNLKLRLVVSALGMILATMTNSVQVVQFVFTARQLCCSVSGTEHQQPTADEQHSIMTESNDREIQV